ncbi:hypothetical protein BG011_009745 [Mortierella polycephala]|uniref:Uncharacterized protein n=1 Tax=Mortierella polycephala TaxID=41804 RepID=A0A9P6TWF4_9FUNG|nr:hypothetical protein BG011_009745 [Mortierella polycephala]
MIHLGLVLQHPRQELQTPVSEAPPKAIPVLGDVRVQRRSNALPLIMGPPRLVPKNNQQTFAKLFIQASSQPLAPQPLRQQHLHRPLRHDHWEHQQHTSYQGPLQQQQSLVLRQQQHGQHQELPADVSLRDIDISQAPNSSTTLLMEPTSAKANSYRKRDRCTIATLDTEVSRDAEDYIAKWWSNRTNYQKYKNPQQHLFVTTKVKIHEELAKELKGSGKGVYDTSQVRNKMESMQRSFQAAKTFLNSTGIGNTDDATLEEQVKKKCRWFYLLYEVWSEDLSHDTVKLHSSIGKLRTFIEDENDDGNLQDEEAATDLPIPVCVNQ